IRDYILNHVILNHVISNPEVNDIALDPQAVFPPFLLKKILTLFTFTQQAAIKHWKETYARN
ncbi:MAG: hypothetical protein WCR52_23780, partial [Bacteroidota bacterium]